MAEIIGFNYGQLDAKVRKLVKQHTEAIHGLIRRTVDEQIEIGRRMAEVRDLLHGRFKLWAETELPIAYGTCCRLIRVAEKFGHLEGPVLQRLTYTGLEELAKLTTADSAVEEAIAIASSGKKLDSRETRRLIEKHPRNYVAPRGHWHGTEPQRLEDAREPAAAADLPDEPEADEPEQPTTVTGKIAAVKRYVERAAEALSAHDQYRLADELLTIVMRIRSRRGQAGDDAEK